MLPVDNAALLEMIHKADRAKTGGMSTVRCALHRKQRNPRDNV